VIKNYNFKSASVNLENNAIKPKKFV